MGEAARTLNRGRSRPLAGASVVVVGASSGIGRAAAVALAGHGARLTLAARGAEPLAAAVEECRRRGAEAIGVPTDAADPEAIDRLVDAAVRAHARIDVWVHAAATLAVGRFGDEPVEELQAELATDVVGYSLGARAAIRQFRVQGAQGTLVLVGSVLGIVPNPLVVGYVTAKFAITGLARALQRAVAAEPGIRVALVLPGPVDTPLFAHAANTSGHRLRAVPPASSVERAAAAVVRAARRPRRQHPVGAVGRVVLVGHRLSARATERAVAAWSARLVVDRSEVRGPAAGNVRRGLSAGEAATQGRSRRGRARRRVGDALGRALARRGRRRGSRQAA